MNRDLINRDLVVRRDAGVSEIQDQSIGLSLPRQHGPASHGLLRAIWAMRRRLGLFCVIVTVATILAATIALIIPPTYTATARLIFDPRKENITSVPQVLGDLNADSMAIDSQVEILRSRAIVIKVVRQLHLASDPEFATPGGHGLLARWFGGANDVSVGANKVPAEAVPDNVVTRWLDTATEIFRAGPFAPSSWVGNPADLTGEDTQEDVAVNNVADHLDVRSVGLSSVIEVSFRSRSAAKAIRIADAIAEIYIADQVALKEQATDHVAEGLRAKLDQLRANADASDAALKRYQVSHRLVGLQSATGATAVQQEINALTQELTKAQADEAAARAKLDVAATPGSNSDLFGDAMTSPVIQELKKQRAAASATLAQLSARYGSSSYEVIAAQRSISDIDAQMRSEIGRVRQSLAAGLRVAQNSSAALQARLQTATNALQDASIASVDEMQLRNRAEADRAVYQSFLDRFAQTSALIGMERPDARFISRAARSMAPTWPRRNLIVMCGFLIGCTLGVVVTTAIEFRRGGIYNPAQLADDFRLRWLGSVPELKSIREPRSLRRAKPAGSNFAIDIPVEHRVSTFSEMVRGILASPPFNTKANQHKAVMLTSSLAGEGKTTTSVALARTLALQGVRVLLVDCDLRRRGATRMLGEVPAGIVEFVNGKATCDEVVQLDEATSMKWIGVCAGTGVAGTFALPNFPAALAYLRQRFDILLLDSPPMLATADARWLALQADCVVITTRWAKTRCSALRATLALIDEIGLQPAGAILTRVDLRKQRRIGGAGDYAHHLQYQAYQG